MSDDTGRARTAARPVRQVILHEADRAAPALRLGQVAHLDRAAPVELGIAERRHPRPAHLARRQLGQAVEHGVRRFGIEALAPVVALADAGIQAPRDAARGLGVRRLDLVDVHAVENRLGNRVVVVGGGDPDHLAGVDRHLGEFVGERMRGIEFEQAVQRTERVVGVFAAGLVDLVDHHHRVRILAIDQRLEHLAGARALPLRRGAAQHPAGRERTHRDETHAGSEQAGQLAREVRLAHTRRAQQQRRRDLQRVAAVLAQRQLAFHVVEHLREVRHLVVQVVHRR
jgi:hypothetical protein